MKSNLEERNCDLLFEYQRPKPMKGDKEKKNVFSLLFMCLSKKVIDVVIGMWCSSVVEYPSY